MGDLSAAVTGIGVVSSVGIGYTEFAESLAQGVSGLDVWSGSPDGPLVGEVVGFDVSEHLVAEKTYLDRCSELALAATKLCLDDAGTRQPAAEHQVGLVLGTMFGCAATMAAYTERVRRRGARFATPLLFSHAFANTPASLVSIDFRLRGYHTTVSSGAASGAIALSTALVALALGHAQAVLAGGVEALTPELLAAWRTDLYAADDPDEFDPFACEGTVLGEGAAVLLLERPEAALARGAQPRARIAVDGPGADLTVVTAGAQASGPAVAPEGLYGHALGAAGALAAATAVVALEQQLIPPVRGGDEPLAARREPQARRVEQVAVSCAGAPTLSVTRW